MKKSSLSAPPVSEPQSIHTDNAEPKWRRVVRRRSFLHGVGAAAAILPASSLFAAENSDRARENTPLTRGDAAVLRLAAAIELIEADLWQQYNELGGAVDQ